MRVGLESWCFYSSLVLILNFMASHDVMLSFPMKEIPVETASVNAKSSLSSLPISIRHQAYF